MQILIFVRGKTNSILIVKIMPLLSLIEKLLGILGDDFHISTMLTGRSYGQVIIVYINCMHICI